MAIHGVCVLCFRCHNPSVSSHDSRRRGSGHAPHHALNFRASTRGGVHNGQVYRLSEHGAGYQVPVGGLLGYWQIGKLASWAEHGLSHVCMK